MLVLLLTSFLTLVQLNCENLFDFRHDTLKNDLEFTPEGSYHWTKSRYYNHLNNTASTIIACAQTDSTLRLPDIVTLCEVENDSVMYDLTRRSLLRTAYYGYVMTSSADPRGIDIALLYNTYTTELLSYHSIRVEREPDCHPSRDLLYAKCRFLYADTVHIVVTHSPSRRNNSRAIDRYRMRFAKTIAHTVDSILSTDADALVIVTGDFNDYDRSSTLRYLESRHLDNISKQAQGLNGTPATYYYRRQWKSLDHILCSPYMSERVHRCFIGDYPFLLESTGRYNYKRPFRSFQGTHYHYGYSDHLPLIVQFLMPEGF